MCKKLCSLAILVVMLAALPVWAGGKQDKKASEGFATVTDHQGRSVVIPQKPEAEKAVGRLLKNSLPNWRINPHAAAQRT